MANDHGNRPRRLRRLELGGACALLLLLALSLAWDWAWLKRPIEHRVETVTGRSFRIEGSLDGHWGRRLVLEATDLRLGNPDWAHRDDMGRARRLQVELGLGDLLRRRVHRVEIDGLRLSLERGEDGLANWDIGRGEGRGWDVGDLVLRDGRMEFEEPGIEARLRFGLESATRRDDMARTPLRIEGGGTFRGEPVEVRGGIESPLELRDRERPFQLALRIVSRDTLGRLRGTLHSWIDLSRFDLALQLEGPDLSRLYPLLRLSLPASRAYAVQGRLRRDGNLWRYDGIEGRVGESDLRGEVRIDVGGERPHFQAQLESARLDFVDLAGFLGVAPGEGEALRRDRGRVFPDSRIDGERLLAMDADVVLRAERLVGAPFPADSLDARLVMDAGLAVVEPLRMRMAGGRGEGRVQVDARADGPLAVSLVLTLQQLSLPRLIGQDHDDGTRGRSGGRIELAGRGHSLSAMAATATGRIELAMGPGAVGPAQLSVWNLDGGLQRRALGVGRGEALSVNCGLARFAVADGMAASEIAAVETPGVHVIATGGIDLGREQVDLTVATRPRSGGLMALRAPVRLHGPWLSPQVDIDAGPLLLRGLAAAALYTITPPAVLLALLEAGDAEDVPCLQELRG